MLGWLLNFIRPKQKNKPYQTRSRKHKLDDQKKHIGRPKGEPTEKLTIKIPVGLKSEFRKFCEARNMSISFAVASFMKRTLAEQKLLDYQTFTSLRRKPRMKKLIR